MARTNATAVGLIIDTDLTSDQVNAFIDDANLWVTQNLGDAGLSTSVLTAIEKYLAAHFITLRDPRLRNIDMDGVRESYQRHGTVSEYVKTAASMDPTGTVEDRLMEGRPKLKFRVGAGYDSDLDLPEQHT